MAPKHTTHATSRVTRAQSHTSAQRTGDASASASASSAAAHDTSALRPLSEHVLRAVNLHGGVDHAGRVRDLRAHFAPKDARGEPDVATLGDSTKGPFDFTDDEVRALADENDEPHLKMQLLERKHGGLIERITNANGTITLKLHTSEGDAWGATGTGTLDALDKLIVKAGGLD